MPCTHVHSSAWKIVINLYLLLITVINYRHAAHVVLEAMQTAADVDIRLAAVRRRAAGHRALVGVDAAVEHVVLPPRLARHVG